MHVLIQGVSVEEEGGLRPIDLKGPLVRWLQEFDRQPLDGSSRALGLPKLFHPKKYLANYAEPPRHY